MAWEWLADRTARGARAVMGRRSATVAWARPVTVVVRERLADMAARGSLAAEVMRQWLAPGVWLAVMAPGVWLAVVMAPRLAGQGPDAQVRGIVTDRQGKSLRGVDVTVHNNATGLTRSTQTDAQGRYLLGSLPAGVYDVQAQLASFQGSKRQGIRLEVGAKDEENFLLAPLASLGAAGELPHQLFQVLPVATTLPVETIASSVSVVVDENKILLLPLEDRNIYSLFLLQPGVTGQGAIVRRGLSFAVHGQRVSGSNYLIDGIDNNDIDLTGPTAATSAEAIQEFRMVNSSFSAENGRATAFVAQVATRAGTNRFHGSLLEFLANDKLNAGTFADNAAGNGKSPVRHNQFGYSLGGPIQKDKLFFTSVLELSRLRFRDNRQFTLPTASFIQSLPAGSLAGQLLTTFPPIASTPTARDPNVGTTAYGVPSRIDNLFATERVDYNFPGGKDRLMARFTVASTDQQLGDSSDFIGYPSLRPVDHFGAHNTEVAWTHSFAAGLNNDFKVGWSRQRIQMPRPQPGVPIIQILTSPVLLPGSKRQADTRENNNVVQFSDTFSVWRGRSAFTAGFDYRRNLSNRMTLGIQNEALGGSGQFLNGIYFFPDLTSFVAGRPLLFSIAVDRFSPGNLRLPNLARQYRSGDWAGFLQDDFKVSRRFSVNLGLRYEFFGVSGNTDPSQDVNFYWGSGSTIEERLANGVLRSTSQNPGDLKDRMYRPDRNGFAPSIGLAWDPLGHGRTVVRAGYAVAYDRVFDTIRDLSSNNQQVVNCLPQTGCTPRFLLPASGMLPFLSQTLPPGFVVQLDENLRTPYAQNWYVGVQHTVTPNFLVEIGHSGSVGRKLISRDVINRTGGGLTPFNKTINEDTLLSNAGNSNYVGLEVGLRRRFSRGLQYQVSYTYSHAIDNQSDIFEGTQTGPTPSDITLASLTRQFDAQVDRGNANFDQRQNLVFNAIWDVPAPHFEARWAQQAAHGWTLSTIGAYRTGFPLTAIGSIGPNAAPGLRNNRVDFVGQPGQTAAKQPVTGGVQWLDPSLFRAAATHVGSLGRGALPGPGFWNYDLALLRNIAVREGVRLQLRAEFYNLFNHANLATPVTLYSDPNFGKAYYGVDRTFSRFGDLPLDNPSRLIQFGMRLQF